MNARKKLNTTYLHGSLLFAVLVGWLSESFLIFVLTAAALLASSLHDGNIRLNGSQTGSQSSRRVNRPRR